MDLTLCVLIFLILVGSIVANPLIAMRKTIDESMMEMRMQMG